MLRATRINQHRVAGVIRAKLVGRGFPLSYERSFRPNKMQIAKSSLSLNGDNLHGEPDSKVFKNVMYMIIVRKSK